MVLGSIQIKGEVGIIDYSSLGRWLADYDGLLGMDVIGSFILAFYPSVLKKVLQVGNFNPEAILTAWEGRGWLLLASANTERPLP